MTQHDEYRRRAKEAQVRADKARNDDDKSSWLRVAQGWLSMLPAGARTADEKFDAETKEYGTGQAENKSSN